MLNDKQQTAIETTEGPLLVLAGAGSGKTTVLINRIENMIKNKNIKPENILAIAFTNKAANEMKERLENKIGKENSNKVWISTYHKFCQKIINENSDEHIKTNVGYTIANSAQVKKSIKGMIKELNIDDDNFHKPSDILKNIALLKNEYVYPNDLIKMVKKEEMKEEIDLEKVKKIITESVGKEHFKNFTKIYMMYENFLSKNNYIDLEDILNIAFEILNDNEEILEQYQEAYKYLMIDEFQDTNQIQSITINLLAEKYKNIAAVGDDNQSIFGFRGSDIRNILNFEKKYPKALCIKLEENYRSTKNILNAANELIKNNKKNKEKLLFTNKEDGEKISFLEFENTTSEATFIASKVKEYIEKGVKYKDIALFYRNNSDSATFERIFKNEGIPFKLSKDGSFFEQIEIVDILKYLTFIANDKDANSFKRIINKPKRSIGTVTIEKIVTESNGESIIDVCKNIDSMERVNKKTKDSIISFVSEMEEIKNKKLKVSDLIKYIAERSSYKEFLNSFEVSVKRQKMRNINKLIEETIEMEKEENGLNIYDFINQITKIDFDSNLNDDEEYDEVNLTTVHSAKGKEFPIVFIVGTNEGSFPSEYSIILDQIEEERRLMYVAITRAKEKLYFTRNKTKTIKESDGQEKEIVLKKSRFLDEIPNEYF